MNDYYSLSYNGPPFVLFSLAHLLAISVVVLCWVLLALVLRRASAAMREGIRHGLAVFALLNVVAWQAWQWQMGIWVLAYSLPLHICTFANLLAVVMLWTRSYRLFEVLYFWGFAGATAALLTPDIGRFGFPHFVFLIFFTSHGITPASVVYMLVAEGYRPSWASVGRATLITIAFLAFVGLVNWLTGGNYMFVARTPEFASPIRFLGPWPWYIGGMVVVGMAAFALVYLPFAMHDWRTTQRART